MEKKPHALAVVCPAKAHVISFLKFCNKIVEEGIKVTFVKIEFIHSIIINSMIEKEKDEVDGVTLLSIPNGLQELSDRIDALKILGSLNRVLPYHLMDLIGKINQSNSNQEPITAVIANLTVGWILDVIKKIGTQQFGFWSSGPIALAFFQTLNFNHEAEGDIMEIKKPIYQRRCLARVAARWRVMTQTNAKSKSKKFPPPHQDATVGYPLDTSNNGPVSIGETDNSFNSTIFVPKSS